MTEFIVKCEDEYTEELLIKQRTPQIVRCKNCKHRPEVKERKIYGRVEKYPVFPEDSICPACNTSDSYYSWIPEDDWFCADGEPKEGENDGEDTVQTNV